MLVSNKKVSLVAVLSLLAIAATPLHAQEWAVPRTEFGHPNLQGLWINRNETVFERPIELGDKRFYTEEEAQAIIASMRSTQEQRVLSSDPDRPAPPAGEIITNVADANFHPELYSQLAYVDGEYRTSLIIDPPNGRIDKKEGVNDIYLQWLADGHGVFDGPEIRPANERCLNSPGQVPLVIQIPPEDSKTMQIFQTEDYVVLNPEYVTSVRIVALDREEHSISWPQWRGTSTAQWEGDSLVIHSKNFRREQSNRRIRTSSQLEVVETYTLVSDDVLLFRFTFTDPVTMNSPFTGEIPLTRMDQGQRIYESACHEGNYSVPGILAGARRQEQDAKQ